MQHSNYLDERFVEEVKNANNIVEVIAKYVELKKNGENYKGLCPFHNEKTPSFMVSENKQIFKCFGCGEGGNVISFLMKKENISFTEAVKELCENARIPFKTNDKISEKDKIEYENKKKMYALHIDLAKYYFNNLQNNMDNSKEYLKRRGVDEKAIKKFGLGYENRYSDSVNYLMEMGYTKEELLMSMVFREKNDRIYSIFFSRIIYPIIDYKNRVIGFGGRGMDNNTVPKYLNSPESIIFKKKNELYGLNLAKKYNTTRIILVEGYMDVISLNKNGIVGAVASLGTSLTKEQAEIIKRQNKKVFICYDSDTAGRTATIRAIDILQKEDITPYIISLGNFKDPDEFFLERSSAEFMSLLKTAISPLTFIIDDIATRYDLSIHSQNLEFINMACKEILSCEDEVEKEYQIRRLAEKTGASIKSIGVKIYGEYFSPKRFEKLNSNSRNILKMDKKEEIRLNNPNEDMFFKIILENPNYINFVDDILTYEDIRDEEVGQIYLEKSKYEDALVDEQTQNIVVRLAKLVKIENLQRQIEDIDKSMNKNSGDSDILEKSNLRIELVRKVLELKESLKDNV